MGAQLRIYRRRMRSVKATKKITKAMELISASRIVKAQTRVQASTPYANELTRAQEHVLPKKLQPLPGGRRQRQHSGQLRHSGAAATFFLTTSSPAT